MPVAPTTFSQLAVEFSPPVARIELRNPPLNVIHLPMMEDLAHALAEIETRSDVSITILQAAGQAFSAGVEVAVHTPDLVQSMLSKFHSVIRALICSRKLTIAAVHGHCLGGGAELAIVCDLVYTTSSAQWGFPEIKLGCYPPVACAGLAALVGQKRAAELILTGKTIDGKAAAQIGLATRVVEDDHLGGILQKSIEELVELSASSLALAKKAFGAWNSAYLENGLARAERIYLEELANTADAQEGIRAFLEKRPPRWMGK
jgi:cyclohexa-1,5-dienecarbonyl-CoA hydratase